jgi:hypothetical protein
MNFRRLGVFDLEPVEVKGASVRELKTIFLTESCDVLRIRFHKHWPSRDNIYNQVGCVGLICLGSALALPGGSTRFETRTKLDLDLQHPEHVSPILSDRTFADIDPQRGKQTNIGSVATAPPLSSDFFVLNSKLQVIPPNGKLHSALFLYNYFRTISRRGRSSPRNPESK